MNNMLKVNFLSLAVLTNLNRHQSLEMEFQCVLFTIKVTFKYMLKLPSVQKKETANTQASRHCHAQQSCEANIRRLLGERKAICKILYHPFFFFFQPLDQHNRITLLLQFMKSYFQPSLSVFNKIIYFTQELPKIVTHPFFLDM